MGQNGSCIQGSVNFADDDPTYTSATFPTLPSNNTELLKHLTRRLSASDRHSVENIYGPLPRSRACPRHGKPSPQERRQSLQRSDAQTSSSPQTSNSAVRRPLNEACKGPLYKETYCKRVNFNEFSQSSTKDLKTVSLKPAISNNPCRMHRQLPKPVAAKSATMDSNGAHGKPDRKSPCPVHSSCHSLPGHGRPRLAANPSSTVALNDSFSSALHAELADSSFPRTSTPKKSALANSRRFHSSHQKVVRFSPSGNNPSLVTPSEDNGLLKDRQSQMSPPPYRFPPSGHTSSPCSKPESQVQSTENIVKPILSGEVAARSADDDDSGVFTADEDCPPVQSDVQNLVQRESCKLPGANFSAEDAVKKDTEVVNGHSDASDGSEDSLLLKISSLDSTTSTTCLHEWLKSVKKLKGKTVKKDPELLSALAVYQSRANIETLEERAEEVVEKFSQALKQLDLEEWQTFYTVSSELCVDVQNVLRDYGMYETSSQSSDKTEVRNHATNSCTGLSDVLTREKESILAGERKEVVMKALRALGETLHEVMEFLLGQEISVIVEGVKEGGVGYCAKLAIETITELGQSGELMARLITKAGGTRALLAVYIEEQRRFLRPLMLKALTVLCSSSDTINELEQIGAANRILEILCEEGESDDIRAAAGGLLAQITAPTSKDNATCRKFTGFSSQLVKTLTGLAHSCKSSEFFLLISSVLANMTVFTSETGVMVKHFNSEVTSFSSHEIPVMKCSSHSQQEVFQQIALVCAMEKLSSLNATDLVKAKLWDSLMLCCPRQESYV